MIEVELLSFDGRTMAGSIRERAISWGNGFKYSARWGVLVQREMEFTPV
jgi:hypothetical protein